MEDRLFQIYDQGREVARCKVQPREEGWASLEEVFVAASHRGQGLARRVCSEALAWCKDKELNILLTATPIMEGGLDAYQLRCFYESLGFTLLHADIDRYYLELINDPTHLLKAGLGRVTTYV